MTVRSHLTARVIACLSLSCAIAACGAGTAGPTIVPSDPIGGAEPAGPTGYEPPGDLGDVAPGPGSSVEQLCAYDCMRFEASCPGSGGGPDCAASCVQTVTSFPACAAQFQAYLACAASAQVTCTNGSLAVIGCDGAVMALNSCSGTVGGGSAGSGGTK
jgi:hypothetical protein